MNAFFPSHIAAQILIWAMITAGLFWLAMARSIDGQAWGGSSKQRSKLGLAALLVAGFAFTFWTARAGTYRLDHGFLLPNLVVAILVAVAIGSLALFSRRVRAVVGGVPQFWLAGTHGVRIVFGYVFIACYELGELPASFAFAVGYGDVLSGVIGVTAAYLVVRGHRLATASLVLWNVVGIVDFLNAVPTGIIAIAADAPFQSFFPFYLIPGFVVPLLMLLHVYSIRGLVRGPHLARTGEPGAVGRPACAVRTSASALPSTPAQA